LISIAGMSETGTNAIGRGLTSDSCVGRSLALLQLFNTYLLGISFQPQAVSLIGNYVTNVGLMKEVPKYEIHDLEKIEVEIQAAINVS
jgi:hypothetical protein